jgi:uncharacterized protein YyaL (SSP411 family)
MGQRIHGMKKFLLGAVLLHAALYAAEPKIDWQPWSDDVFQKAKAEHKLVLLDLGAVWCHWCHVMDETTYRDPDVIQWISKNFIAVRVDQDARPDLSNRYEDYGWPATVIFAADGSELAKRQGYLPPKLMASMLEAFVKDPTPGPSVVAEKAPTLPAKGALSESQVKEMQSRFFDAYDDVHGGWGDAQKFLNWDALEFCLSRAEAGDARAEKMAKQTLKEALKLIDQVWGGMNQYSTDGDWNHPHFEKIMPFQTESLRVYAQAYELWGNKEDLAAAQRIHSYLQHFLMGSDGVFYASQDADLVEGEHSGEYYALDDAGRRAKGIPRIDKHLYARENGLAIVGLLALYDATQDVACLNEARGAAEWVVAHRSSSGGGFSHDEKDSAGPYLADTLCMARAFLQLHASTGERVWLTRADDALKFIDQTFRLETGYATAASSAALLKPKPQVDENVTLVRVANLLHHYTGDATKRKMAEHAMRYLAAPEVIESRGYGLSGILMADEELRKEPQHLTVLGGKDDPAAAALFAAALCSPRVFKRVEWWDRREGPLANPDTPFPELARVAIFVCADGACSPPIYDPAVLAKKLARHR